MSKKRKRQQSSKESVIPDENTSEYTHPENKEFTSEYTRSLTAGAEVNVQKKVFHAVKEIIRALKKARDFEVRKIIKRIKTARYANLVSFLTIRKEKEPEKVSRLELEL